jgi:hypothetical protein
MGNKAFEASDKAKKKKTRDKVNGIRSGRHSPGQDVAAAGAVQKWPTPSTLRSSRSEFMSPAAEGLPATSSVFCDTGEEQWD